MPKFSAGRMCCVVVSHPQEKSASMGVTPHGRGSLSTRYHPDGPPGKKKNVKVLGLLPRQIHLRWWKTSAHEGSVPYATELY